MTASAETGVAELLVLLRRAGLAVGVDDAARVATVFRLAEGWTYARRLQALQAILARSDEERDTLARLGPVIFADQAPPARRAEPPKGEVPPTPRRWPWLLASAIAILAIAYVGGIDDRLAMWMSPVDPEPTVDRPPDAGAAKGGKGEIGATATQHWVEAPAPHGWVGPLLAVGGAAGFLAGLGLGLRHLVRVMRYRRGRDRVKRLRAAPGRRVLALRSPVGRDSHPIQPASLVHSAAFRLSGPTALVDSPVLDGRRTVEASSRAGGRMVLRFERRREHQPTLFLEDISPSMQRWPAHAGQIARALELQGQGLLHRFASGDPRRVSSTRGAPVWRPLEQVMVQSGAGQIVAVSDLAWLDDPTWREDRHLLAELPPVIWIHPRPADLWGPGARWLAERACVVPSGSEPELRHLGTGLEVRTHLPPRWHPPTLWRGDPDEVARVWRVALGDEAWDALAAAAILESAGALDAAHLWALVSDEIVSAPWERLDRIWDLPGVSVLPGGRLSFPEGAGERMTVELRRRRPELAHAVGSWLAARVQGAIEAAGADSLAAQVGQVHLDRIARAADLDDPPGARVARLVSSGLGGLAASNASPADLAAWRLDPGQLGPPGKALPIAALTSASAGAFLVAALAAGWFRGSPPRAFGFQAPPHPNYGPADWTVRITPRPVGDQPLQMRVVDDYGAPQAILARDGEDGGVVFDASVLPRGTYTVELGYAGEAQVRENIFVAEPGARPPADAAPVVDAAQPDAGQRSSAGAQCDVVLSGRREYRADATVPGRVVCLSGGAWLRVRNGRRLELAAEVIRIEPDVVIDGTGERGAAGAAGAPPARSWRTGDKQQFTDANRDCNQDGHPDRGKPGGRGGAGGPGATIVFSGKVEGDRSDLDIRVAGGPGGRGGAGGQGRLHELVVGTPAPTAVPPAERPSGSDQSGPPDDTGESAPAEGSGGPDRSDGPEGGGGGGGSARSHPAGSTPAPSSPSWLLAIPQGHSPDRGPEKRRRPGRLAQGEDPAAAAEGGEDEAPTDDGKKAGGPTVAAQYRCPDGKNGPAGPTGPSGRVEGLGEAETAP
jgi:hypothetical protein